jgi:predicted Zn-dependent protease
MRCRRALASVLVLVCAAALVVAACSSAPKSSDKEKKRTVLHTSYDDERVGREASRGVAAEIGLLNDPAMDAYVSEIGRKLLRGVPRRSFQYQFSVVDQFEPNAFALPGGYIFISRGLLALANSEDELANVIGHEITHAARRHSAAQQALAVRQNPLAMGWQRSATLAAYGRDMEREADEGGQILASAAGYDPMGMSTFLRDMGQMDRLVRGHARRPTFMDTHPGSLERAAANAARSSEIRWRRDPALGDTRARYLRRIDGLALGDRPETGIFEGDDFFHPAMDFHLRFPHGWRMSNTAQAVGAISPRGDAVVFLSADQPAGDPQEMAEAYFEKTKEEQHLKLKESQPVKLGQLDAWRMKLEGSSGAGSVSIFMVFVPYGKATFRITGMSLSRGESKYRGRFLSMARSFRPLTPAERSSIQSMRLSVVTARPGEGLVALGQRTGNAWDPSRTAVYNGLFANHRFEGGELVKIAHVEAYAPRGR